MKGGFFNVCLCLKWNLLLLWKLIEFWMEETVEWDLLGSLVLFWEYTEEENEIREK